MGIQGTIRDFPMISATMPSRQGLKGVYRPYWNDADAGDEPTIPQNVLLSADGYFLTDIDGKYLMPAKKEA